VGEPQAQAPRLNSANAVAATTILRPALLRPAPRPVPGLALRRGGGDRPCAPAAVCSPPTARTRRNSRPLDFRRDLPGRLL